MAEAGLRNRYVTIERLVESAGESSYPVDDWEVLTTVFASREETRQEVSNERFAGNLLTAPFETYWEMSYRDDMDPEVFDIPKVRRLVYMGRTYDITHAEMIGFRTGVRVLTLAKAG